MSAPDSLVVLLHGVGATGGDLAPLASALAASLPNTAFASPDAPYPFDGGGPARRWCSTAGITAENRPPRVAAGRAGFDRIVEDAVRRHGFADRLDRVALVGFSQGAIMALDAVASGRWTVAAAVDFSGRLASPEPLMPAARTPVLVVHGSEDSVVPVAEANHAFDRLRDLGVAVRRHVLAGVGHAVPPEAAAIGAAFLAQVLAPSSV